MVKLLGFVMATLVGGGAVAGESLDQLIERESNAIGNADRFGYTSVWQELGGGLSLGDKTIPLRLRFSTAPEKQIGSIFGRGWWCPILESCVVQSSDSRVILFTPSGSIVILYRSPQAISNFASRDGAWSAVERGNEFSVEGSNGVRLGYRGGKIERLKVGGIDYQWQYKDGRAVSIVRQDKGVKVANVGYSSDGLVNFLAFEGGREYQARYKTVPVISPITKAIVKICPSVAEMRCANGPSFSVEYNLDGAAQTIAAEGNWDGLGGKSVPIYFRWEESTGLLLEDLLRKYSIEPNLNPRAKRPTIVATFEDGTRESYAYDETLAIAERLHSNGTSTRYHFIKTPGGAYGRARKIELLSAAVDSAKPRLLQSKEYYYNAQGECIRKVSRVDKSEQKGQALDLGSAIGRSSTTELPTFVPPSEALKTLLKNLRETNKK